MHLIINPQKKTFFFSRAIKRYIYIQGCRPELKKKCTVVIFINFTRFKPKVVIFYKFSNFSSFAPFFSYLCFFQISQHLRLALTCRSICDDTLFYTLQPTTLGWGAGPKINITHTIITFCSHSSIISSSFLNKNLQKLYKNSVCKNSLY